MEVRSPRLLPEYCSGTTQANVLRNFIRQSEKFKVRSKAIILVDVIMTNEFKENGRSKEERD
jgi:hypothetical protein